MNISYVRFNRKLIQMPDYRVMKEFAFERLAVWQESRELASFIYNLTNTFPKSELYGITNQIRRCSISVPSNIAESTGRRHPKEKKQFISIAYSSLIELLNQAILAQDFGYITEQDLNTKIRPLVHRISYKLSRLQQSLNSNA